MHSDLATSAYVPFLRGEEDEGAHRVAFLRRVHDEALVSNDPRDVEAVLERAAAGSDLQPHKCSVLQDRFQSAVVSYSYVTAQSENDPRLSPHTLYMKGAGWMGKRD